MRIACFTVDLDRDVNIPISPWEAGSTDRGYGVAPRFKSSVKGSRMLSKLFTECGIDATFFAEARTLQETPEDVLDYEIAMHGLEHEDLSMLDENDMEQIIFDASDIIWDMTGQRPEGFRAPYMKPNEEMYQILTDAGVTYDSSDYIDVSKAMRPYEKEGLTEIPVPKGTDKNGKNIYGYLWAMHENKRSPQDYIDLASKMDDGIFVIATHSWHMVESVDDGMMDSARKKANSENVRQVIEGLQKQGFEFASMSHAARITF